jgi:ergothioneine biosynthesis protein EgtB
MDNTNIQFEYKVNNKSELKSKLVEKFKEVRDQTLEIVKPLEIEDYVVQTEKYMSPPRWHLGHLTWFYDQLLRKYFDGYKKYKEDYDFYFNSYYLTFGQLFDKSKRGTISRPTVKETLDYWNYVNRNVEMFFRNMNGNFSDEIRKLFELGFQHEYQHQELMVYDLQNLLADKYSPVKRNTLPHHNGSEKIKKEMIRIPGGIFEMGFSEEKFPAEFAYDIEKPSHKVYLTDFLVDKFPVTNGDYLEFINDGGYDNFKLWLSDGWGEVKNNNWNAPMYWYKNDNDEWYKVDFRGEIKIEDIADEPVAHVSFYEAYAYAKWTGKRLPAEAEWEKAASFDEDEGKNRLYPWGNSAPDKEKANLFESRLWQVSKTGSFPKGKSYYGCEQMLGDTWEWTTSEFMPYPGFKSGFSEYNDKWFGNQKVLRGGSFGTSIYQTRNTYRNFFRPEERWLISGFRCAKDV